MTEALHLQNAHGESFILWVDGYEFPELENEPYDANWLNIGIEVQLKQGSWTAIDPCILTTDMERLIKWFTLVGINQHPYDWFVFLEPSLSFELRGKFPNQMRIHLKYGFKPDWIPLEEDVYLEILLDETSLLQIINALESMSAEFPTRYT